MPTDIQQTKEALVFIAGLIVDLQKAYSDDKTIGKMEIVRVLTANLGSALVAFKDISEVPAELADIMPDEADELYWAVATRLNLPDNSVARSLFNANYNFLRVCVEHWRVMQGILTPPRANIVE